MRVENHGARLEYQLDVATAQDLKGLEMPRFYYVVLYGNMINHK